jgi:hypothetical protein
VSRTRALTLAGVVVGCVALAACATTPAVRARGGSLDTAAGTAAVAPTTVPTTTTTAPTTSTTLDPGTLPQTTVLPKDGDPVFQGHVQALWRAVVDGNPAEAMSFFFPASAYAQVKAIADPEYDWQTRLVADFDSDVLTDHRAFGSDAADAQFVAVSVPPSAHWVAPGTEYNKGSYWRVYSTVLQYTVDGRPGSFTVASMISWRGQWYVVHLASIR